MPNNTIRRSASTMALVLCLGAVVAAQQQEQYSPDAEIATLKREMTQIRSERQRNRDDAEKDRRELSTYQQRTTQRRQATVSEADSVRQMCAAYGKRRDSLSAAANALSSRIKELELTQTAFRQRIIDASQSMTAAAAKLPPNLARQITGSLTFLESDCRNKTIDNVEALNRLVQIAQNIEDAVATIDAMDGENTVPALAGSVRILRIGAFFAAAVDQKGERAAIWDGYDAQGAAIWRLVDDPAVAARIQLDINVREGKALPAFVELPFDKAPSVGGAK